MWANPNWKYAGEPTGRFRVVGGCNKKLHPGVLLVDLLTLIFCFLELCHSGGKPSE